MASVCQGTTYLQQLRWDQFRCAQCQWMLWAFDAAAGRTHLPTPRLTELTELTELPEIARSYHEHPRTVKYREILKHLKTVN
jgi:hypothetical protein